MEVHLCSLKERPTLHSYFYQCFLLWCVFSFSNCDQLWLVQFPVRSDMVPLIRFLFLVDEEEMRSATNYD